MHGQRLGAIEQLGDAANPQNSGALEGGIKYLIIAGDTARMVERGPGAFLAPADFEHDDRLGTGKTPGRAHKPAGLGQGLHVNEDGFGLRVVAEIIDQVMEADIHHIPDGDKVGKTDVLLDRPIQDCSAQGAALRDKGDPALYGAFFGKNWRSAST